MTTPIAKIKRFAHLTIIAAAMAAAGLGLGAGTAQARPVHQCPTPHMLLCNSIQLHNQIADNFFDGTQRLFGIGEGTMFDHAVDRFFGAR